MSKQRPGLTTKEQNAIETLERLAKRWPFSLWLFSAGGALHVMKKDITGKPAMDGEGFDQEYSVAVIYIENNGGDW